MTERFEDPNLPGLLGVTVSPTPGGTEINAIHRAFRTVAAASRP